MLAGHLALVLAAAFAGAAFYVNFAEQPARLTLDDRSLLAEWKPSYSRGALMQASIAMVAGVLGIIAAILTYRFSFLVGAVLILAPWPFTLLIIKPTNDELKATSIEKITPATRGLILQWGRLHAVRTALGCAATFAYLYAVS